MDDLTGSGSLPDRKRIPHWLIVGGLAALLLAGGLALVAFSPRRPGIPPSIAHDPILSRGFEIYQLRCLSCHGAEGKGDGPISKGLAGPPPRNLAEDRWKHGELPDQVLRVLQEGVNDTAMPAWGSSYSTSDLKSVAAYVYRIAGREVPGKLRSP